MYVQATLKRNIIPHNVAHRIVNRVCKNAHVRVHRYGLKNMFR